MKRTEEFNKQDYFEILAIEAFGTDSFLAINKALIKSIGLIQATLLSLYIDKYKYFKIKHPENDGWFFATHETIMEELLLSEATIRKNKSFLINDLNIIKTKMMGQPAKEYIKINFVTLVGSMGFNIGSALSKSEGLGVSKSEGLYKKTILKENIKEKIEKKSFINLFPKKYQDNSQFIKMIEEFSKDRSERKCPLTNRSMELIKNKLVQYDVEIGIEATKEAIEKGYRSIFPESIQQRKLTVKKYHGNFDDDKSYEDAPLPDHILKQQRANQRRAEND